MNYKRKRDLKGLVGLTLAAVVLLGSSGFKVAAAQEEPQEKEPVKLELTVYEVQENFDENVPALQGMVMNSVTFTSKAEGLCVDITTCATGTASVLGTKDIELHEKNALGWHTVGESEGYTVYNRSTSGCTFTYEDAVYNRKYRVKCTHFANVNGYEEDEQLTNAYTYNYKK